MRLVAAVLALAALAAGCGTSGEPEAAGTVGAPEHSEIAGETLDGERLSLADFRGRPVFVNVWSSW